ncbi:leucine-rich repeat domain-containing protein [archaeon]|nr:MAG: leucine-rich repeat domain-containing protein [archaeon]
MVCAVTTQHVIKPTLLQGLRSRALSTLRASHNELVTVDRDDLQGAPGLEELDVSSNRIVSVPGVLPLSKLMVRFLYVSAFSYVRTSALLELGAMGR